MKRRRNQIPNTDNDRWFERYGQGGYFCLPRNLIFNIQDCIDNATLFTYIVLASCHMEGNTTYASGYVAKLLGKDAGNVRQQIRDLVTLGLIKRVPLGRGYKILFECPTRARVKEGAALVAIRKAEVAARRKAATLRKRDADIQSSDPNPSKEFELPEHESEE